jgi:monoamine oxidase
LKHQSLWFDTDPPPTGYPTLEGERRVDVAVIGAGITGMTAALLLARAGGSVAVLASMRSPAGPRGTAPPRSPHSTG